MHRAWLLPLAAIAIAAACSSEPSASDAPPDGGASSSSGGASSSGSSGAPADGGGAIDADSLPAAKGDPCRGVALPPDEHYVPQGLCARLVATGIAQLRQITFTPDGVLFGVSIGGNIWRIEDVDGDGFFQASEVVKYASTNGGNGNDCDIDLAGGFLYAGSATGVKRFTYAPGAKSGGDGEDVVVNQPGGGHPYHTVHVYDGYLYVHSGSEGNATDPAAPEYDTSRSLVKRFKLSDFKSGAPFDWSTGEVVTVGLRNMVGFKRNAAGRIYGVVNGLDEVVYGGVNVHDDNPGEQLVEVAAGNRYGYPFCFTAQRIDGGNGVVPPGTQLANPGFPGHDDAWCGANSMKPVTFMQAHSAPLDIQFFDAQPKGALPEKWRGGAFVAMHGSWDRQPATGYKVVWIPFDAQGNAPMPTSTATDTTFPYEIVFGGGNASGPKDGPWSWSVNPYTDAPRPVGVAISPVDGALYISTDSGAGMLYRVGVQK